MNRKISIVLMTVFTVLTFPLHTLAQTTKVPAESVAELLAQVKKSEGDARRQAMNLLKLKLKSASQETRQQTLLQLRKDFAAGDRHRFSHTVSNKQNMNSANMQGGAHGNGAQQFAAPQPRIPQQPSMQTKPQNKQEHGSSSVPRQHHGGHH